MDPSAVKDEIDKILCSQSLAGKGQLRKLLEILSKNVDEPADLNPDQVIRELWPDEIRTKRAADVATGMNRLRHALDAYYQEEGKTDPIRIVLPNRAVSPRDGTQEKRWIVAEPCDGTEVGAAEERAAAGQTAHREAKGHRRRTIFAILAAAAILGAAGYALLRMRTKHDEPRVARLDGSALIIMNAEGKELWRKIFPEGIGPDWYYAQGIGTRTWIGDLEGRGRTSVLFVYSPARPQSHSSTVICYTDEGKERWRWNPGRELPELAGSPATYKTFALAVLKGTDKRPRRIVASSGHDIWWPTQIALLDSDGKVISEYWHSGRLDFMVLGDLDGDGKEEIVATGVSEYDHQATLVVLDPDQVSGASTEERPEFQIQGMGKAQERLRLLFPRSDLNRALYPFNQATDPIVEQGKIRLTVQECSAPDHGCRIWYEFDRGVHLISAFADTEEFRSAHARFYQNGKNAHALSAEELAAFQKVRCLVGCKSEFVPVGNLVP